MNSNVPEVQQVFQIIEKSFAENTLIKMHLADCHGDIPALKKCIIKPAIIRKQPMLSVTYRYKTKDETKNYPLQAFMELLNGWVENMAFKVISIHTTTALITLQYQHKWRLAMTHHTAAVAKPTLTHDKMKRREITDLKQPYLHLLGLTNDKGDIYKDAQDKYKQINHYIQLIAPALKKLTQQQIHISDMGAGKGYLTFALFDYIQHVLQMSAVIVGVEYRQDLVDICNGIAEQVRFNDLHFVQGTIENYVPSQGLDVLIALHACDTATDDAIWKGIAHEADIIVTAPCCHKQVRQSMDAAHKLSYITRFGIFLERQAEMLTDTIRTLVLEYYGYKVKVMEFISDAHTAKNVMILAERNQVNESKQSEIIATLQQIIKDFGIKEQQLIQLSKMPL